jgi:hypothetical protein
VSDAVAPLRRPREMGLRIGAIVFRSASMSGPDYELHKLGWRAFQDLCGVVLQEVLGQTFTAFADTNDAGQDGAFHGLWTSPGDAADPIPSAVQHWRGVRRLRFRSYAGRCAMQVQR